MRDIQTLCESTKLFWKQTSGKPLSFPPYDETERKHNEAKLQEQLSHMTEDVQEIKALLPAFLDISWMSKQDQQQFETAPKNLLMMRKLLMKIFTLKRYFRHYAICGSFGC